MKQIKLKKYLIGALSFVFAFVLGLGVWTGFGLHAKEANAAGETYTLTFKGGCGVRSIEETDGWFWAINGRKEMVTDNLSPEDVGGKAVKYTKDAANDPYLGGYSKVDGFTQGVTYTTSFWLKTVAASEDYAVKAWMPDSSFATVSMPVITTVSGSTDWTRYEYTWTANSTSSGTAPLRFSVTAGQGSLYIDEVDTYQSVYTVTNGGEIGTVPNLPKQNGKSATWLIDGEVITASTVYNYTENKTAVAAYANTLTLTQSEEITEKVGEFAKVYNAATAELTTAGAYNGKAISLVRTDGTAGGNASFSMTFNGVSVTAGETYTVRFKLKTAGSIHVYHIADGSLYTWASTKLIDDWVAGSAGAWVDCSYTYTSAYTQENLILGFQLTSNANSVSALIDELYVESPTKMTVIQGAAIGTLPALEEGKAWTIDGEVITENTIWNYSEDKTAVVKTAYTITFQENVKEDWIESEKLATGFLYQAGAKSVGYQSSIVATGDEAIKITTSSEAYAVIDVMGAGLIEYKAGETYTVSFKAYGNSFHLFIDHGNPKLLDDWINPGTGWFDYELTFTVPDGVTRISFLFKSTTAASEQNIYIDDLYVAVAKEDVTKTVVAGAQIGTLPALPDDYFWTIDGEEITENTVYNYGMDKTAIAANVVYYTLTFEGVENREIEESAAIGVLPAVPEKAGYTNGKWTIDGVEITADTLYTYGMNKTAVAVYDKVYTLSFESPDMIESMKSGSFGAVHNATFEITKTGAYSGKALHYAVGTVSANDPSSPWICLSAAPVAAGEYIVKFKMLNSRYVNLYYQPDSFDYESMTSLQANVSTKAVWTEYEYPIILNQKVTSLYLLMESHPGTGDIYIDDLYFGVKAENKENRTLMDGSTIGTLPTVPQKNGYKVVWTIDGDIITEDTVWTYTENKTAKFSYKKGYTLTFEGTEVNSELAEGERIGELPAIPAKAGYVGSWRINGREITASTVWNYEENMTATIEYKIDLDVDVEIKMEEGAAIRVATASNSGIRFETRLNKADYDALVAKYGAGNIETGTYILPYSMIGNNGIYAYVTDEAKVAGTHYVQVVNEGWYNAATAAKDGYYQWYGSLVRIKPENYALNYVGIGYVKVTVGEESILILAGEATLEDSRSIYQVAYKAYIDEDNGLSDNGMTVLENYLNEVAVFVSNESKSALDVDVTLKDYGYEANYILSKSAETGNYIVTAAAGRTINALIIDGIAYRVTPANKVYFSYYMGLASVMDEDEASAMSATIATANELKNGVQATYTNADWDAYKVQNQNMSLTHGLKEGNVQVTNLTNSAGAAYLSNTLDAYVVSSGSRVYGNTGSNTYGNTVAGSARLNTTNLGYYYYEANVRDITFSSSIPLYLSKTYHVYSDKVHQEFTVVASGTTSSSLTALGFEMKIPKSSVAKYIVDGTANASVTNVTEYIGFDINGVGVVGIIVAGDDVTVTLTNDGTNYIVRQEKAMSILSEAGQTEEELPFALTSENTISLWNRLYTDETHTFEGITAANNEEQNPLKDANIVVSTENGGGAFDGYDYATGAYSFVIDSVGFNTAYYDNPDTQFTESITIKNAPDDRTVYIQVKTNKPVEGAAIMDEAGKQIPIPVQVGKNFGHEKEEPIFDPTDAQWGITVAPIRVEKARTRSFTVVNAMQNWGEIALKQLSSISYYVGYYHLSTGVTETNCIAPYFSYSNSLGSFNNAWILPDFRGGDTMKEGEPQYDSVGMLMGVTNGATSGYYENYYGTDLGVYVGSEILSSGMTYADVEYSYVSENGDYEYTYRHVEMPQTDEARTYYTLTLKFLKDTYVKNNEFSLFSLSSRNVKYTSYEYLDANGNVVNGKNPTKGSFFAQSIDPLYKGASYFALYGVSNTGEENGNFGLIVKDYAITVNGASSTLGLAFKNDFIKETQSNLAGLTLASSTSFKAGDAITLNVILLPYDKNVNNANNVRKVYQDSVINSLTVTATTGTVVEDTWLATVKAANNAAQFTVSGGVDTTDALSDGADNVNYTIKVTNCTKLSVPVIEEYVNGAWQTYTVASVNGYDGYSVERNADGTLTYSFVITKSTADRTFRVSF